MKKKHKKIFGGLMIFTILAVIGVSVVSAQSEDGMFWGRRGFMSELTDEQREDIQSTMQQKFEEYGIEMPTPDEMLEKRIERTNLRLDILNRQKELRELEYEWEDIKDIIQEEFELEFPEENMGVRFRHGRCKGLRGSINNGDSEI
jgi:hypothetical protein